MSESLHTVTCQVVNTIGTVSLSLARAYDSLAQTADNYADIGILKMLDLATSRNDADQALLSIEKIELQKFKLNYLKKLNGVLKR